jgi:multimeric flavodoxin WrbA
VVNDELTPILAKIEEANAIILGSPNYIGSPICMMKAFLERLIYPYVVYDSNMSSLLCLHCLKGECRPGLFAR